MLKIRTTFLIFLLWFAWVALAAAQQPVGEVVLSKGLVKVRHLGKETFLRRVGQRHPVFEGDIVQSGAASRAKVKFKGKKGDVVDVYARTHFTIKTVKPRRTFFGLNLGKALFSVFRKKRFQVRTPTATIGVKGTKFVAGYDGRKSFTLTVEGVVTVRSTAFPKVEVTLLKNEASSAAPNEPPTAPLRFTR